jgi:uncharacterized protein
MASFIALVRLLGIVFALQAALIARAYAEDQNAIKRRCLSIADVDTRVECLETGIVPDAGGAPTANPSSTRQSRVGPSFDCRMARTSIERAICSDATLSEWDYHMGRLFQRALEYANDRPSFLENQRLWLAQRDSGCGAVADTAVWTCLLETTKARANSLAQAISTAAEANQASQPSTPVAAMTSPPASEPTATAPSPAQIPRDDHLSNTAASQINDSSVPVLFIVIVLSLISALVALNILLRRRRLAAERKRISAEKERFDAYVNNLVRRYGPEATSRILAHEIWQGMTEDQLIESRGHPSDMEREIKREKTKETWKYYQTGKNRFRERIYLENGIVIGWKH